MIASSDGREWGAADALAKSLRETRRGATRVLFAVSVLVAPVPFFILFLGGFVPLPFTCAFFLRGLTTGDGAFLWVGILGVHVLIDGGIVYAAAAVVSRLLFALFPMRVAVRAVGFVIAVEAVATFLPIYALEGDSRYFTLWGLVHWLRTGF
jgi:hypothetical protein